MLFGTWRMLRQLCHVLLLHMKAFVGLSAGEMSQDALWK